MATEREEPSERRHHKRFRVHDGTLAVFGHSRPKVGFVTDISEAGLAFRYTTDEELPKGPSKIDILLVNGISHLYGLPCEPVHDADIRDMPFTFTSERRRAVKFGQLTPEQKMHLEDFIRNHTAGECSSKACNAGDHIRP